ncbi:hypothetical protein [Rhizobium sp. Rhizsp42]|uniref:hypothetical protein n=1 Tax=Rhizobium sp. Rhizsp42 TaxID=3243034 RepID=UPI0039B10095
MFIFPGVDGAIPTEFDWDLVKVGFAETIALPIGNSGWTIYNGFRNVAGDPIQEGSSIPTIEAAFELAGDVLRNYPIIPLNLNVPYELNDGETFEFWTCFLEPLLASREIEDIAVSRDAKGVVSFAFSHRDAAVTLRTGRVAEIAVDGVVVDSVRYIDQERLIDSLEQRLSELDAPVATPR